MENKKFEQGDTISIPSKNTFGIVVDSENDEIIVLTVETKSFIVGPNEIEHCPDEYESECDQCNGTGEMDVLNCFTNTNECCGGCFKTIECHECDGTGMITKLISENT
jgi:DnaJ-class molecular chaperone